MPFNYNLGAKLPKLVTPTLSVAGAQKKLRRIPHIFSRILELPFHSNADVSVCEDPDCFEFALTTNEITEDVEVRFVEIVPGISKIVVGIRNSVEPIFDELELDVWRFRLPPSTMPELAIATYTEGRLIVTVPKSHDSTQDCVVEEVEVREKHRDAKIHGQYGSGGQRRVQSDGSVNRAELVGKLNGGGSNASRIHQLVRVQ